MKNTKKNTTKFHSDSLSGRANGFINRHFGWQYDVGLFIAVYSVERELLSGTLSLSTRGVGSALYRELCDWVCRERLDDLSLREPWHPLSFVAVVNWVHTALSGDCMHTTPGVDFSDRPKPSCPWCRNPLELELVASLPSPCTREQDCGSRPVLMLETSGGLIHPCYNPSAGLQEIKEKLDLL